MSESPLFLRSMVSEITLGSEQPLERNGLVVSSMDRRYYGPAVYPHQRMYRGLLWRPGIDNCRPGSGCVTVLKIVGVVFIVLIAVQGPS